MTKLILALIDDSLLRADLYEAVREHYRRRGQLVTDREIAEGIDALRSYGFLEYHDGRYWRLA